MERLEITAPDKAAQLKIVWTSPLIPADPLVWRKSLSDEQKNRLREFFMSYGAKPAEKETLHGAQWAPFSASDDDPLVPIRPPELAKTPPSVAVEQQTPHNARPAPPTQTHH